MLPLRQFGATGLLVSPVGLGTVKLGRNTGVRYPEPFEIPDDARAADLLRAAARLGVNLIDTAPAYGESEERLGRILPACGGRGRWTIVTKAGEEFDPATGESRFDFSPKAVRASVERSLTRLKTAWIDGVLLHSDGRDDWVLRESGAVQELLRLKRKGLVRACGISTKTPEGAMLAVELGPAGGCDIVMLTLNASERDDLPAVRAAASRGVGVLIKKALMSGRAGAGGVDEAMRLCLSEAGVSAVVVGTVNPAHLEANALAAERALA